MRKRWAIFISGTGSNMMAALDKKNRINVVAVVTSNADAIGGMRARRHGLKVIVFTKNESWEILSQALKSLGVTHIFLAGFMKILPGPFVKAWKNRIVNIHPSLLPAYPGLKSIERAYDDKSETGATLHMVDEGVDTGAILLQKKVGHNSTLQQSAFAMHVTEHQLVRTFFERADL